MAVLGERMPRSTQQVIEATETDRVKVSRAVIRLADKGLLARKPHLDDKRVHMLRAQPDTSARVDRKVSSVFRWLKYSIRAVIPGWALSLTRRGLGTYRQIVPHARRLQTELAAALTPEETQVLDRILAKLHASSVSLVPRLQEA